jgi:hypothetical protein
VTWSDAVTETQADDVRETVLEPGARVHVDAPTGAPWAGTYVITNLGDRSMQVAIWVNPRQPNVKVWDPTGKNPNSIEVQFTGEDTTAERGALRVDRLTQPG